MTPPAAGNFLLEETKMPGHAAGHFLVDHGRGRSIAFETLKGTGSARTLHFSLKSKMRLPCEPRSRIRALSPATKSSKIKELREAG